MIGEVEEATIQEFEQEPEDRAQWLGGEAMVRLRGRWRTADVSFHQYSKCPASTLLIVFLAGAALGSGTVHVWHRYTNRRRGRD